MDVDLLKNLKISEEDLDELSEITGGNDKSSEKKKRKSSRYSEAEEDTGIPLSGQEDIDEKVKSKRKKEKILRELDSELYYLGTKEGTVTECRDPEDLNANVKPECRGVLRKRIKSGLIMEYVFTSQERGIKNFHLNNVKINLNEISESKLEKLLIIVKFYNEKHREIDEKKNTDKKDELSSQEKERLAKEKKEESKRKLVLGKL